MTTSAIQPIPQQSSLSDYVQQMLSTGIISGELAPGELLTVPTLAGKFGVSATPVREAMLGLARRGFVESVRNKGFRVTSVSDEELSHIVQVRLWLEPPAMYELAADFPEARAAELRSLADEIVAGAAGGDLAAYLQSDHAFHMALTRLLGNHTLAEMVADLRSRTRLVGLASMIKTQRLQDSAAEHVELLDFLAAGDQEGARDLMAKHIHHTLGWWSGKPEDAVE
ncbi:GntR family transcriptional regulator [Paramicrobacterium agarici]|uniref:GntR family transcriptional regulator n=1 Tax=Paramicrobacterium agarici TaxID=630514 RepID=UPI0011548F04|nr:GntR family transcriptional regulator [Microbacterium agarici]TQO23027.1 GntR family transcriptional regulator [Microbacterium agarici]